MLAFRCFAPQPTAVSRIIDLAGQAPYLRAPLSSNGRLHMSGINTASLVYLALFHSAAVADQAVRIETAKIALKAPPYELIQFATEGQPYDGPINERNHGRFHRLVVLSPEIAYDHPRFRIETITYGDEACCIRLVAAYELPVKKLGDHGIKLPESTRAEFKFHHWLGSHALEFAYGPLTCVLSGLGNGWVSVACKP